MPNIPPPANWPVECTNDGFWRHVNHTLRLASPGWGSKDAAEKNALIYRVNEATIQLMSARYEELYPTITPNLM
ncbi:hypothetical protein ACVIGB_000597 [Bradyrhizobium sp. USDA 4341]